MPGDRSRVDVTYPRFKIAVDYRGYVVVPRVHRGLDVLCVHDGVRARWDRVRQVCPTYTAASRESMGRCATFAAASEHAGRPQQGRRDLPQVRHRRGLIPTASTEIPDLSAPIPAVKCTAATASAPGGCTRLCTRQCTRRTRSHTRSMPLYPLCPLRYPIYLLMSSLRIALWPLQVPPAALPASVRRPVPRPTQRPITRIVISPPSPLRPLRVVTMVIAAVPAGEPASVPAVPAR